jgi:hypothetical protein
MLKYHGHYIIDACAWQENLGTAGLKKIAGKVKKV